jgi:AcrR family transcriptional regulator
MRKQGKSFNKMPGPKGFSRPGDDQGDANQVRKEQTTRDNRRLEILHAAEKLMLSQGLSGVTTRQIAKQVGCSEGALYVHFKGRLELLLAMLEERVPDMIELFRALEETIGKNSPQENLGIAITGIYRFHKRIAPLLGGLFGEPKLLAAYRKSLLSRNKGPHLASAALERYIEGEQKLGRIDEQLDPKVAASLLLSSSFFRAFVEHFFDRPMQPAWEKFAAQLIATVIPAPG